MIYRKDIQALRNLLDQLLEKIQRLFTQFKSQLVLEVENSASVQNERVKNYSLIDSEWILIKQVCSEILSDIGHNINDTLIATNSIEKIIRILENEDIRFESLQFQLPSQIDNFVSRIKNSVKIYIQEAAPNEISEPDGIFSDNIFFDHSFSQMQAINTKNVRSAAKIFEQKTETISISPVHKNSASPIKRFASQDLISNSQSNVLWSSASQIDDSPFPSRSNVRNAAKMFEQKQDIQLVPEKVSES